VTSVTVSGVTSLISGQTQQFTAKANFSDNSNSDVTNIATWSSSDSTIATVSATGFVTAVSTGTASISASYGGQTGSLTVSVQ
jgi:uncharacterized protein YjdB